MKKLALLSLLLLSSSVFANISLREPEACPDVAAIKAAGVHNAMFNQSVGWLVYNPQDALGTKDQWTFAVIGIDATDEGDAIEQANAKLGTLALVEGPTKKGNHYGCVYKAEGDDSQLTGVAVTPPVALPSVKLFH